MDAPYVTLFVKCKYAVQFQSLDADAKILVRDSIQYKRVESQGKI